MKTTPKRLMLGKIGCRSGFTLLEIMMALTFMVITILALLYSAMAAIRLNRMTELEVAGTNAITAQLDSIVAISQSNMSTDTGQALALLKYFVELHGNISGMGSDYPINVAFDDSLDALVYDFPVAAPGAVTGPITGIDTNILDPKYQFGRGSVCFYLKEESVPKRFYNYDDVQDSGSGETATPAQNFFDMNGDKKKEADYSAIMKNAMNGGGHPEVVNQMDLARLPFIAQVRYYRSKKEMDAARISDTAPGFAVNDPDAIVRLERTYIVNNSKIVSID